MSSIITSVSNAVVDVGVFSWDALLTVYNLLTPNLAEGKVVPEGQAGYGGKWPEYIPPTETDSRSACPALNAMANHGTLLC
jgi:Peroxidase, family 2